MYGVVQFCDTRKLLKGDKDEEGFFLFESGYCYFQPIHDKISNETNLLVELYRDIN